CAACKCLRRKCPADCILAPYFPSWNPQRFAPVHNVFGAANMAKMLEQVPAHLRGQAADCMIFEAAMRMIDPVYGSAGIISKLQQQIKQMQIMKIQGEVALHQAQTILHLQQLGDKSNTDPGASRRADADSNNGQHYELDLDEFYVNFISSLNPKPF
uniref:LOB domain-containing protein n=1 Tax=Kalanchoe fedtschenkoi TaxID=63787 RepID=A0A7N0T8R6_KALFE